MKLQQKYFLSYLFFISLFSVFLAISFYVFFSVQARNDLRSSAENTFSQTATLLNYQFKQYLSTTYIVNNSEEVTNVHDIPQEEISDSIGVQYRESISLRNVMNRSIMSLTDVQMRLYVDDSFHSVLDHTMLENVSYLEQFPWYEEFMSGNTLTTWQQTSQVKNIPQKKSLPSPCFERWILPSPEAGFPNCISARKGCRISCPKQIPPEKEWYFCNLMMMSFCPAPMKSFANFSFRFQTILFTGGLWTGRISLWTGRITGFTAAR